MPSSVTRLRLLPLFCALCFLLQGCWTVEQYLVRVKIDAAGSYKFFVEGRAAHTATLYALRRLDYEVKTGKVKGEELKKRRAEVLALMDKDLEAARKDKRIQYISAAEDGRVRFTLTCSGSIGGGELIFSERMTPLAYSQAPEGAIKVLLKDLVVGREAQELQLKVEGDAAVTLAEGIEVLGHNAHKTPTSPVGAYRWRVQSPADPVPYLVLRLPARE